MQADSQFDDMGLAHALKDLSREIRRTRDMAGRATALAGTCVIVCMLILCVTMLGLDGLRENIHILATANSDDFVDATEAAIEETQLGMDTASRMAGELPQLGGGDRPGDSKR